MCFASNLQCNCKKDIRRKTESLYFLRIGGQIKQEVLQMRIISISKIIFYDGDCSHHLSGKDIIVWWLSKLNGNYVIWIHTNYISYWWTRAICDVSIFSSKSKPKLNRSCILLPAYKKSIFLIKRIWQWAFCSMNTACIVLSDNKICHTISKKHSFSANGIHIWDLDFALVVCWGETLCINPSRKRNHKCWRCHVYNASKIKAIEAIISYWCITQIFNRNGSIRKGCYIFLVKS